MQKLKRIMGVCLSAFVCLAAAGNPGRAEAQIKKIDKERKLDELQKVEPSKLSGVWERQGTLEIDGNTDVETIQFNEDGSISYRQNGQISLFPTPYTYTSNYGQIEIKAVFDFYFIDNSLIVIFADKKVKNFTRRRTAQPQGQGQPLQMQGQQQLPQQQQQQQLPRYSTQPQMQPIPGGQTQNLNPYLR